MDNDSLVMGVNCKMEWNCDSRCFGVRTAVQCRLRWTNRSGSFKVFLLRVVKNDVKQMQFFCVPTEA